MHIDKLFSITKSKWPQKIFFDDGKKIGNDGFLSWKLVRLEEEAKAQSANDSGLLKASVWPFHQSLACLAKDKFTKGHTHVYNHEVKKRIFEKFLLDALDDISWEKERMEYQENNP